MSAHKEILPKSIPSRPTDASGNLKWMQHKITLLLKCKLK